VSGSQDRQRKVALSVQVNMKADLHEIYGASTLAAAEAAIDVFADKYGAKYDKAVASHRNVTRHAA
jgi:transposase-like protein